MTEREKALLKYFLPLLTEGRKAQLRKVLEQRTSRVTAVLENLFHAQNASAVLRTCEALGIQDVNIVTESYGGYTVNPDVVVGASKWLSLHEYSSSQACLSALREQGYKIVATSPRGKKELSELDVSDKTAFIFGAEAVGVSEWAMEQADETVAIPMFGFTESFNVSVSAALCLRDFTFRLRKEATDWQLPEARKERLYLEWVRNSIRRVEDVERYFEEKIWNS